MQIRLSRRNLLEKCMALGVATSATNLSPSVIADAWARSEANARSPTAAAELGPFYKRLAPEGKSLRQPGDPGMPLVVGGAVFSMRGEALPGATMEVWQ